MSWPSLEETVRELAAAGVDAVIVQDLGLVRLDPSDHARSRDPRLDPDVDHERGRGCAGPRAGLHARHPGPRAGLTEIDRIRGRSTFPVEVFVHGALCVAYSGQCLTSEALGGRSANRGECAQACRMPYEIVSDGRSSISTTSSTS